MKEKPPKKEKENEKVLFLLAKLCVAMNQLVVFDDN